jgi:transposase
MALSKDAVQMVREAAKEAGDHLKGKLPPCPFLKERNSYAHIWERLKARLGKSYKDCDDEDLLRILELIQWYRNNPC